MDRGAASGLLFLTIGSSGCDSFVSGQHEQQPTGSVIVTAPSSSSAGSTGGAPSSSSAGSTGGAISTSTTGGAGGATSTTTSSGAGGSSSTGAGGCTSAADCPGADDECQTRTCQVGACGVAFTAAETPVTAQTPHDCLLAVCDGNGSVTSIADDVDLPLDDGNACTDEACNVGAPAHPARANGSACSDGDACTQGDTCQAGVCTGGAPVVCSAPDMCHLSGICDPATGTCSQPAKGNGTACDDGDACTQTDTCQAGACVAGNPVVCSEGATCVAGACLPPTTTWADCNVGFEPTKDGGSPVWVKATQLPPPIGAPGALQRLALGPTGDIALGVAGFQDRSSAFQRLNGSGVVVGWGYHEPASGGASGNYFAWGPLSIASDNRLRLRATGNVGCTSIFLCTGPVVTYRLHPTAGADVFGSLDCQGSPSPGGYCLGTLFDQTLTPVGLLTTALPGIPDGVGGRYVSGAFFTTIDLGCGPMVATASTSGYVAHLDSMSSCIYSHVLPAGVTVAADVGGAVLSVSSTAGLDLGCGTLAAAAGGSTLVTRLDPTGACVFGRSLPAPGLAVAVDPSGRAVVSGLVSATAVDLGGGPLAPLGTQDVVLAELGAAGNHLWSKRFGGPGINFAGPFVSVSAAGDVYLRTGWSGSLDVGGGSLTAAPNDTVVASYSPSGAHRWSRGFPIVGTYLAGVDGCGALVLASVDPTFNPGKGQVLPPFPSVMTVGVARFAP